MDELRYPAEVSGARWLPRSSKSSRRFIAAGGFNSHSPPPPAFIYHYSNKKGAVAIHTATAPGLQTLLPYWEKMFLAVLIFNRTPQVTPGEGYP